VCKRLLASTPFAAAKIFQLNQCQKTSVDQKAQPGLLYGTAIGPFIVLPAMFPSFVR
jgi:hypothetical protein